MKYDYSMTDGDFYRTYGVSQEQAAATESAKQDGFRYLAFGLLAVIVVGYNLTRPVKVKKLLDRPGFRESPITAAFKYA